MKKNPNRPLAALGIAVTTLPLLVSAAEEPPAEELEVVVVTGTRIARAIEDTPNPVTTYDAANVVQSGLTNLTELLIQTPQLIASTNRSDASGSTPGIGAAGLNLLNLRNLGVDRTLVLVNTRRHVGAFQGSAAIDMNTIPLDLIERIDILTGGVSAIYGADGVSGVVNIVTKRNFEGLTVRGQTGISNYGDGGNNFFSMTTGKNYLDGAANVALNFEYNKDDRIDGFERSRGGDPLRTFGLVRDPNDSPDDPDVFDRILQNDLRYADSSRDGGYDTDFDFVPDFTGGGLPYDLGTYIPGSSFTQGGSSTPTAGYQGDRQARTERYTVNLLGDLDITESMRVFTEAKYVRSNTSNNGQPNYTFYDFIGTENPFIPDVIRDAIVPDAGADYGMPDGLLMNRDNFDFGLRIDTIRRETVRNVIGLEGKFDNDVKYELSYNFGQSKIRAVDTNSRIEERFYAALDAVDEGAFLTGTPNGNVVCRIDLMPAGTPINPDNIFWENFVPAGDGSGVPITFTPGSNSGCVPLNLFGEGTVDPEAVDFVHTNAVTRSKLTQHVVSGSLTGDLGQFFELPGGPLAWAFGAEYRKEKSLSEPDQLVQDGLLWGYPVIQVEKGSFDVKEVFAEFAAPLLRDRPWAHTLSVGGAVRLSDYSTVGNTTTWKLDATWAPIRDIMFRGTYSEAVRAPNIAELFSPTSGTFEFIDDPCDADFIPEGTEFRAANCVALLTSLGIDPDDFNPSEDPEATTSLLGRSGGNPNLGEETAKSWTLGFVLRPSVVPGLSLSLDWYDIKLRNAIATAEAQDVVDLCVDQPTLDNPFCESVGRDEETGFVNDFLIGPQNVAEFRTSGIDLMLAYGFEIGPEYGRFNLRLSGGYLDKLTSIATVGAEVDDEKKDTWAPEYTATTDLTWVKDALSINYGINYFSKTRRFSEAQKEANPDISDPRYFWYKAKFEHDLRASYQIKDMGLQVFAGVNNLFNQGPSPGSLDYPTGYMGRFFYGGVRFDLNGLR